MKRTKKLDYRTLLQGFSWRSKNEFVHFVVAISLRKGHEVIKYGSLSSLSSDLVVVLRLRDV